jgi:hypothetical protein
MKAKKSLPIAIFIIVSLFTVPFRLFSQPTIDSATTVDADENGHIDHLVIQFSEAVDVNDPAPGLDCLSVSDGYTIPTVPDQDYTGNGINPLVVAVEEKAAYDTGAAPTVTYHQGQSSHITATGGAPEVVDLESEGAIDGAGPVISDVITRDQNTDGMIDRLEVTFSEGVDDGSVAAGDFSIDGGGVVDGIVADGGVNDAVIWLDITWPVSGTDEKPTLGAWSGTLEDLAVPANTNPATSKLASDGANPVLTAVELTRLNITGTDWWNRVNLTYSEPVWCGDLAPGSGLTASDAQAGSFNPASEHGGDYTSGVLAGYGGFATGGNVLVPGGEVGLTVEASGIVRFDLARSNDGHGSISSGDTAPSGNFTPVANTGIRDADGNDLVTTTPVAPTYGTVWDLDRPTVSKAATYDWNSDGSIDRVELEINDASSGGIQDGFSAANFDITGYSGEAFTTEVTGISGGVADNDANDNRFSVTFTQAGPWDTDATPGYGYTGSDIYLVDLAGNRLDNTGGTASDGALPAFKSIRTEDTDENGYIDRLLMEFSENVDVNDAGGGGDGLSCIVVSGYTIQSGDYGAADMSSMTLNITEGSSYDTGAKPVTSYSTLGSSTIRDRAPAPNEMLNGETTSTTDGAKPIMISAIFYDPDANDIDVGDYIQVEFTENVQLACTSVSDFVLLNEAFGDTFGGGSDLDDPTPADEYISIVLGVGSTLILPDLWHVPGPGNPSGLGIRAGGTACVEDTASHPSPQGAELDIGGAGSNILVTVSASDGSAVFKDPYLPAALMDTDITVHIETQFDASFVAVWYDVGAEPDGLSPANPNDRRAVASGSAKEWTATISHDDEEIVQGAVVQFIVNTDGAIYYFDGPGATGGSVPWEFKIFYEQSRRVTIRNNIINTDRGDITYINYYLDSGAKAEITVYDIAGNPVKVLCSSTGAAGANLVTWDGKNKRGVSVVPGVYYVVIKIGGGRYTRKVLVVR